MERGIPRIVRRKSFSGEKVDRAKIVLSSALLDYKRSRLIGGELHLLEMVAKLTLGIEILDEDETKPNHSALSL